MDVEEAGCDRMDWIHLTPVRDTWLTQCLPQRKHRLPYYKDQFVSAV
jgi:hypothetical protein